jgi:hypothetical protein
MDLYYHTKQILKYNLEFPAILFSQTRTNFKTLCALFSTLYFPGKKLEANNDRKTAKHD